MLVNNLARALCDEDIFQRNKLTPDYWQTELLQLREKRFLVNACRQSGKSLTASAICCHAAGVKPSQTIIAVSPSERQSKEFIRRCFNLFERAGYSHEVDSKNILTIELINGSRIIGLPSRAENLRGLTIDGAVYEEAAYVDDEIFHAVNPMLATRPNAWQIAISTPNGCQGWFHREWISDNAWRRIEVKAEYCPRISPEFLEEQKRVLGEAIFQQEYQCSFVSDASRLLSPEMIAASFKPMGRLNVSR